MKDKKINTVSSIDLELLPIQGYWVWFDVLNEEVLALPQKETSKLLLENLKKEGVTPRNVLARTTLQAMHLGCPESYKKPVVSSSPSFKLH